MDTKDTASTADAESTIEQAIALWEHGAASEEEGRWEQRDAASLLHKLEGGYRKLAQRLGMSKSLVARYGRTGKAFPPGSRVDRWSCRTHERALHLAGRILGADPKPTLEECAEEARNWLLIEEYEDAETLLSAMGAAAGPPTQDDQAPEADDANDADVEDEEEDSPPVDLATVAGVTESVRRLPPLLEATRNSSQLEILIAALVQSQVTHAQEELRDLSGRTLRRALDTALAAALKGEEADASVTQPEGKSQVAPSVAP